MKENQWITHDDSRNITESTNKKNETFENNIIIINFDYNVVENIIVVVKIENKILRTMILRKIFRNKHIKENAFDEKTKSLIKWNIVRVVNK